MLLNEPLFYTFVSDDNFVIFGVNTHAVTDERHRCTDNRNRKIPFFFYQKLHGKLSDEECGRVVNAIDPVIKIPMVIGFLTLWSGGTIIVSMAILAGALSVSKWCLLLNPVVSILVLMTLKKLKVRIIGPLGTGFMLFAVLLIIAGRNA